MTRDYFGMGPRWPILPASLQKDCAFCLLWGLEGLQLAILWGTACTFVRHPSSRYKLSHSLTSWCESRHGHKGRGAL